MSDLFYLNFSKACHMLSYNKLPVYVEKIWELVEDQQDNHRSYMERGSIWLAEGYWESSSRINLELNFLKHLINDSNNDLVASMGIC